MKASVYCGVSLDGFIAREDGRIDWLTGNGEEAEDEGDDYSFSRFFATVDTLVMGRNTFDILRTFDEWHYGDTPILVLSRTLKELPRGTRKTVFLDAGTPMEICSKLEAAGRKHIYVDGGKTVQAFLRAGLIDEITVSVLPVLIGSGIPLFGPLNKDTRLELLSSRTFKTGIVQSRYAVIRT